MVIASGNGGSFIVTAEFSITYRKAWVKVGYQLSSAARSRVGMAVYRRTDYIVKKARSVKNNATRRAERSLYWCQNVIHRDEFIQMAEDIIHQLKRENEELISENQELRKEGIMSLSYMK